MTPGETYALTGDGLRATWTHRRKVSARKYVSTDWHVTVEWEVVDGTLTPVGLIIRAADGATPISRAVVNAMPIGTLIEQSRQATASHIRVMAKYETGDIGKAARVVQAATTKETPRGPGRPRTWDDARLGVLADAYRQALADASPTPTKDAAQALDVSVNVARRQLTKARKMGLLEEGRRR